MKINDSLVSDSDELIHPVILNDNFLELKICENDQQIPSRGQIPYASCHRMDKRVGALIP